MSDVTHNPACSYWPPYNLECDCGAMKAPAPPANDAGTPRCDEKVITQRCQLPKGHSDGHKWEADKEHRADSQPTSADAPRCVCSVLPAHGHPACPVHGMSVPARQRVRELIAKWRKTAAADYNKAPLQCADELEAALERGVDETL
jgi:hypothetical protein